MHNKRQQPCSRTALWNLSSVAQLECPALCRGTYDLDCWNTSCMIERTSTHPWPIFLYRPGLAVYPGGGVHWVWVVPHLHQQTPEGPLSCDQMLPIRTHEERLWDDVSHDLRHFHQLVLHTRHRNVSKEGRRHVHQLFRQLDSAIKCATHEKQRVANLSVVVCCLLFVACCLLFVVCCLLFFLFAVCCLLFVCLLVAACWLLVVGCWLLVVGCWLLVVGCWLLVVEWFI